MNNKNIKEQVEKLWNQGLGVTEISKKLKIYPGYVSVNLDKIFRKGRRDRFIYKRRIFTLNEHFFDEINTEAKAYFLGLLSADGNLAKDQNLVRIGLKEQDKYILEEFNKHLEYTRPLKFVKKVKEEGWNRSDQYKMDISSSILRKDLEKYKLTPNKSATLEFPDNIPLDYLHHYLRGYFDGDGCINIGKKDNKAGISIAGSKSYCNSLISVLDKFDISVKVCKHSTGDCYYARSNGGNNVMKFYEFLYKDATIFLTRKKDIFEKWILERAFRRIKYNRRGK